MSLNRKSESEELNSLVVLDEEEEELNSLAITRDEKAKNPTSTNTNILFIVFTSFYRIYLDLGERFIETLPLKLQTNS